MSQENSKTRLFKNRETAWDNEKGNDRVHQYLLRMLRGTIEAWGKASYRGSVKGTLGVVYFAVIILLPRALSMSFMKEHLFILHPLCIGFSKNYIDFYLKSYVPLKILRYKRLIIFQQIFDSIGNKDIGL